MARNSPFHPAETDDCPVPLHYLTKSRTTIQGGRKHGDRWRTSPTTTTDVYWTGRTIFKLAQRDRGQAEAAFLLQSDGHATYAGSKENRAKDAKKTLSLSDGLLFIEAKRKELSSFFTSQVWEFSSLDEAPAERVLRSHFILKWSKNPDGSPRAKTRLITQGFRISRSVGQLRAAVCRWTHQNFGNSTFGRSHPHSPSEAGRRYQRPGSSPKIRCGSKGECQRVC